MARTSAGPHWHWNSAFAGALISALVLGTVFLWQRQPDAAPIVVHPPPSPVVVTPQPTPTPAPLVIFVSGAVHAPGLYALPMGARVGDALTAAGGLTSEANPDAVNQATTLRDGDQIHVPTQTEAPAGPPPGVSVQARHRIQIRAHPQALLTSTRPQPHNWKVCRALARAAPRRSSTTGPMPRSTNWTVSMVSALRSSRTYAPT